VFNDYLTIIILIASGFWSGVFVGMGSGTTAAIMITCLTVLLNRSVHNSIGTSLLIDSIIGIIAGLIFLRKGNVRLRSCILLIFTGSIGSFLGSRFTSAAPESWLLLSIGILLILMGCSFITKGVQRNIDYVGSKINIKRFQENKNAFFIIFGLVAGFGSGFSGMGIGGIVALVLILILGYNIHTAVGTALIMMFFISGSGAIGHVLNDEIIFGAALVAGSAAIVGAVFGSLIANKIDEDKLGRVIGVIIAILGIAIFLRTFFN